MKAILGKRFSPLGWTAVSPLLFQKSSSAASTNRRRSGPRPTRSALRVACGRGAGFVIGSARGVIWNGGTGGSVKLLFPVFPVKFPVCSQAQAMKSSSSQCFRCSVSAHFPPFPLLPSLQARNTGNSENWTRLQRLLKSLRGTRVEQLGTPRSQATAENRPMRAKSQVQTLSVRVDGRAVLPSPKTFLTK